MTNKENIEISLIKNINLIFFYCIDSSLHNEKESYLGLKIVYEGNKYLTYDYTSEYWERFVSKVIEVYNNEKNTRNIVLLDSFTEEILNNDISRTNHERKNVGTQSYSICDTASRNFEINAIKEYIIDIAKCMLSLFHEENSIESMKLIGYRDKYIVKYKVNGESHSFPVIIIKVSEEKYEFRIGMIENQVLDINGNIIIKKHELIATFKDEKRMLYGNIVYDLKENTIDRLLNSGNTTVFYSNDIFPVTEEEKKLLEYYLILAGIKIPSKIFKTTSNNYLLYECDTNENILKEKSFHINTSNNSVQIYYKDSTSLTKYDGNLTVPLNEEIQKIVFIKLNIRDKEYLIMQRTWLSGELSFGEFKNELANTFTYTVFELDRNSEIKDTFEINKEVNDSLDIEQYVLSRKRNRKCQK